MITNENVNARSVEIIMGKQSITALDFTLPQDREVALKCLKDKQSLSRQLNSSDPNQLDVLKKWVSSSYANLLALDKEQLCHELVDIYLYDKIVSSGKTVDKASIFKSYNQEQVVLYEYETKDGEAVCYFDKALGLPTRLKVNASFRFKLVDAFALVRKIDVELSRVDFRLIIGFLTHNINDAIRDVLLDIIDHQKPAYYELPRYFEQIATELIASLNVKLTDAGLIAEEVRILNITIPNDTSDKLENQYFALAEMERVKQSEFKLEAEALKLYEAKAAIHDKYPNFPLGLTETEKDLALNRYLKRAGMYKENTVKIKGDGFDMRDSSGTGDDTLLKPEMPIAPQEPTVNHKWRNLFICACVFVALAGGLIAGLAHLIAGIAILVIGAVSLTVLGIVKRKELNNGVSEADLMVYNSKQTQYLEDLAKYRIEMEKYEKKVKEIKKAEVDLNGTEE